MDNFFIKQNSTYPILKYQLTDKLMTKFNITDEMMENIAVTFSMVSEDGIYVIANKAANIYVKEVNSNEEISESKYILLYKFTEKDTKKSGLFHGEFKLDFISDGASCSKITLPNDEPIQIIIKNSITKTTVI